VSAAGARSSRSAVSEQVPERHSEYSRNVMISPVKMLFLPAALTSRSGSSALRTALTIRSRRFILTGKNLNRCLEHIRFGHNQRLEYQFFWYFRQQAP